MFYKKDICKTLFDSTLFLAIVVFSFFNPVSLKYNQSTLLIYNMIQALKLMLITTILILYFYKRAFSPFFVFALIYCFFSIITSVISGVVNESLFTNNLLIIGFVCFFELSVLENFKRFFSVAFHVTSILTLVNFVLCIAQPNGLVSFATLYTNNAMNPLYFLAVDNGMFKALAPSVFFSMYYIYSNRHKGFCIKTVYAFLVILVSFATLVIVSSASSLVSFVVLLIIIIFYSGIAKTRCHIKIIFFVFFILFFSIVIRGENSALSFAISKITNRSTTFSGRTFLWSSAIDIIKGSPIIGYGNTGSSIPIWGGLFSSHNMFLEIIMSGGFVLLFAFLMLTFFAASKLYRKSIIVSIIVFAFIIAYWVDGLMEVGVHFFYFGLLAFACSKNKSAKSNVISANVVICL